MTKGQNLLETLPVEVREVLRNGPVMIVDTGAIRRNFRKLSEMTGGICAAIVKGDAYGHGMRAAARALYDGGARLFFTARFEDALIVRRDLGAAPRVAVFDGVSSTLLSEAADRDIIPVINSLLQLEVAANFSRSTGEKLRAFVHIDTAMNRLGLGADDIDRAGLFLDALEIQAYMTHFASADDVDIDLCRLQVTRLKGLCKNLPKAPLSITNSCGVFLGKEFHGDIIRPGKSTFGINPLPEGENPVEEPAMVLAPVVQMRLLRKGDPVGYSSTWHAPDARTIAILAIGYANGYFRVNSNTGFVAFSGHLAPVVGNVSMDVTAVDVTALSNDLVSEGSAAEIVGPNVNYRTLAQLAGTNEHEALISLGRGCHRVYLEG